jgi:hypothetical protein
MILRWTTCDATKKDEVSSAAITVMEFRKAILKVAFFAREIYFLKPKIILASRFGAIDDHSIFSGAKPLLSSRLLLCSHSRAKA